MLPMSALYIREAEVAELVTIDDAIGVLADCFARWPDIRGQNIARSRVKLPNGMFNLLGAGYGPGDVFGVKAYFATAAGARFQVLLYSAVSGELLAILEADLLSKLRTGAASGIATKVLSNPDAAVLGIIGTGRQAFAQVQAISAVRRLESIRAFSRTEASCAQFCDMIEQRLGIAARVARSAEECVREAAIVTTITKSAVPVCRGEWLRPGTHINAAGANAAARRELDEATIARASVLCTDSIEQAKGEAGEFVGLGAPGQKTWGDVRELGDVVSKTVGGRTNASDVTVFKSLGLGIEDVAFAELIYRRAIAAKAGSSLHL